MTRPTLNVLLEQAKDAAEQQASVEINTIGPSRSPAPIRPRGYASPQDVYDTSVGYDSPFMNASPGVRRQMWQIPPVAITHDTITTIKSSSVPRTTGATQVLSGAVANVNASTSWSTVPNMELSLVVNGPATISATIPLQSQNPADQVQFAIYRGGQLMSQIFTQSTSSNANTPSIVSLAYTDPAPLSHSLLNLETYSVYWKATTNGNVTSPGVSRSLFVNSLIPS
jgi:hypothetical protein